MAMKIRLVKGPFGGKVMDHNGSNTVKIRGPKRMTRKQRFEYEMSRYQGNVYMYSGMPPIPHVEATYEVAIRPQYHAGMVYMMPCTHPDGSIFYEFTGNQREF